MGKVVFAIVLFLTVCAFTSTSCSCDRSGVHLGIKTVKLSNRSVEGPHSAPEPDPPKLPLQNLTQKLFVEG